MIVAINYADEKFRKSQILNGKTSLTKGKVDRVIEYGPDDIEFDFREKNSKILNQKRGGGYWLWKPYIINDALSKIDNGDYLIYVDSGAIYVNEVSKLIHCMNEQKTDIMAFSLESSRLEKYWTKRDAFILMDCDIKRITDQPQMLGGYVVIKKSPFSEKIMKEYLDYAQDIRIITDIPNEMGGDNYEGFIDHRHDQSIFSLLIKKYQLPIFRNPSQFGNSGCFEDEILKRSTFPQIIESHRFGDLDSIWRLKWRKSKLCCAIHKNRK